jgi:hypothetical protein
MASEYRKQKQLKSIPYHVRSAYDRAGKGERDCALRHWRAALALGYKPNDRARFGLGVLLRNGIRDATGVDPGHIEVDGGHESEGLPTEFAQS